MENIELHPYLHTDCDRHYIHEAKFECAEAAQSFHVDGHFFAASCSTRYDGWSWHTASDYRYKDKRNPYEAGYDDGYAAGCDDGAAGTDHASYDETNNFALPAEKQNYVKGYREGYAKGYDDGRQGKQFNI